MLILVLLLSSKGVWWGLCLLSIVLAVIWPLPTFSFWVAILMTIACLVTLTDSKPLIGQFSRLRLCWAWWRCCLREICWLAKAGLVALFLLVASLHLLLNITLPNFDFVWCCGISFDLGKKIVEHYLLTTKRLCIAQPFNVYDTSRMITS